jgi:hypothetical protein
MRPFIVAPKPVTSPLQPPRPRLGNRHDVLEERGPPPGANTEGRYWRRPICGKILLGPSDLCEGPPYRIDPPASFQTRAYMVPTGIGYPN